MNDYHDRYREAVLSLIERKMTGKKIVYEEPRPVEAKDLMQALKETLSTLSAK
jgi:DNA end-binding protein Ku